MTAAVTDFTPKDFGTVRIDVVNAAGYLVYVTLADNGPSDKIQSDPI
jgi:hypothetical protein